MRYLLLIALTLLTGCATDNPFNVPQGEAALLQSRGETRNGEWHSLLFAGLDGVILEPDAMTRGIDAVYKAPPGERAVVVRLVHTPKDVKLFRPTMWEAVVSLPATLLARHTYVADAHVDSGVASIWIRDSGSGKAVSPIARVGMVPARRSVVIPVMVR